MKKSQLLFISASLALVLVSCNAGNKKSESKGEEETGLAKALKQFDTNYTATFVTDPEDDYHPALLCGDDFYGHEYQYQFTGFAKVEKDGGKYHAFDHYVEKRVDPWDGEYFILGGRKDFNDDDLKAYASLNSYFDASKFVEKEDNVYHSDDEEQIVGYLNVVNTAMGYYFFGDGSSGVDIVLDDTGDIESIKYWGVGDEDGNFDKDALWATVEFTNVGMTRDGVLEKELDALEEMPTPDLDYVKAVGRDGVNLYEGLEYHFEDMCISSIVGEDASSIGLTSSLSPYLGFETKEVSKFGDAFANYSQLVDFTATISSENGHTILKDIKDVEYKDDCNFDTAVYIEDGETFFYDFVDPEYAKNNNGVKLNLLGATFEGGTVSEQNGKDEVINVSYLFEGVKYSLPVHFLPNTSQDVRSCFVDVVSGSELKAGDLLNVSDVMFRWENGKASACITETSSFEKGYSFAEACAAIADEDVPQYSKNLGVEFFYNMEIPGDDDKSYEGAVAIIDITVENAAKMVEEYSKQLTDAGYTKVREEDTDEGKLYQFNKGDIVIMFTSPVNLGTYCYYQVIVANLAKEILPEVISWPGEYGLNKYDGTQDIMVLNDDMTGTLNGKAFTYEIDEEESSISFDCDGVHYHIVAYGSGSYWGTYTVDGVENEFDYIEML